MDQVPAVIHPGYRAEELLDHPDIGQGMFGQPFCRQDARQFGQGPGQNELVGQMDLHSGLATMKGQQLIDRLLSYML